MYNKQNEYNIKYHQLGKIENFRDLGGYELINGKTVRHDMIFRCGAIFGLTNEEKAEFDKLKIKNIFDFRSPDEVSEAPDYVPSFCNYVNIPVITGDVQSAVNKEQMLKLVQSNLDDNTIAMISEMFFNLYKGFPFNNAAYAQMFEAMDRGETLVFHCSAGKDRTGVAGALILYALGADIETIKYDYMLSNFYRREVNEQMFTKVKPLIKDERVLEVMKIGLTVEVALLEAAIDAIYAKYGSITEYFLKEYAIDETRLDNWKMSYTV